MESMPFPHYRNLKEAFSSLSEECVGYNINACTGDNNNAHAFKCIIFVAKIDYEINGFPVYTCMHIMHYISALVGKLFFFLLSLLYMPITLLLLQFKLA